MYHNYILFQLKQAFCFFLYKMKCQKTADIKSRFFSSLFLKTLALIFNILLVCFLWTNWFSYKSISKISIISQSGNVKPRLHVISRYSIMQYAHSFAVQIIMQFFHTTVMFHYALCTKTLLYWLFAQKPVVQSIDRGYMILRPTIRI